MMTGVRVGRWGRGVIVGIVGIGEDVGAVVSVGMGVRVGKGVRVDGAGEALVTTVITMTMGVGGGAWLQAASNSTASVPAVHLRAADVNWCLISFVPIVVFQAPSCFINRGRNRS